MTRPVAGSTARARATVRLVPSRSVSTCTTRPAFSPRPMSAATVVPMTENAVLVSLRRVSTPVIAQWSAQVIGFARQRHPGLQQPVREVADLVILVALESRAVVERQHEQVHRRRIRMVLAPDRLRIALVVALRAAGRGGWNCRGSGRCGLRGLRISTPCAVQSPVPGKVRHHHQRGEDHEFHGGLVFHEAPPQHTGYSRPPRFTARRGQWTAEPCKKPVAPQNFSMAPGPGATGGLGFSVAYGAGRGLQFG